VTASALLNYYFAPPLHTLAIQDANNALAIMVFLTVAMLVSSVVDLAARRTRQAERAATESRVLADLAGTILAGGDAVTVVLERARQTFGLSCVTLLERADNQWQPVASAGSPCTREEADVAVAAGRDRVLALRGGPLRADDQRLLGAFAVQAGLAWERRQLTEAAAAATPLAEADKVRTALLAAVGHDLRTPLATAKAVVSGLLSTDVRLAERDERELLLAADDSLDRLTALVDNLLDLSRLQSGVMPVHPQPAGLDEIVARGLDALGADGRLVTVDLSAELPAVQADPGLLERVLANLVANALRHSPRDRPPHISASALGARVELRVVDRGPGVPGANHDRIFQPFQRLGDTDNTTGVGLGLALARGLTEAMGGTLEPEETPGGGLTMVISLAAAAEPAAEPGLRERRELAT
jgi:two-component system sensor histidine kinase KdpD